MKSKPTIDQKREQFLHFFIPQYDRIALFTMSLACVLLMLGNFPLFRSYMSFDFWTVDGLRKILGILVLMAGLILSFFNAFTNKPKSSIEQSFMLIFAVTLNAIAGIVNGVHALEQGIGWLSVFPFINILNGLTLVFLLRSRIITERNIRNEDISRSQIGFGATTVVILFIVCQYVSQLLWTETLSICVVYATNLSRRVTSFLLVFKMDSQH